VFVIVFTPRYVCSTLKARGARGRWRSARRDSRAQQREIARLPSDRLSRTPQPLGRHRLRSGLKKCCVTAGAGEKYAFDQCFAATSFRLNGTAAAPRWTGMLLLPPRELGDVSVNLGRRPRPGSRGAVSMLVAELLAHSVRERLDEHEHPSTRHRVGDFCLLRRR
jgi:hypothetical protein